MDHIFNYSCSGARLFRGGQSTAAGIYHEEPGRCRTLVLRQYVKADVLHLLHALNDSSALRPFFKQDLHSETT